MKLRTAVIQEAALVALVASAVEVYDKETWGLLVGSRYKSKVLIKNALVYQKVARTRWEVSIWPSWERKARQVIGELTGYKILGDFHSHPDGPCALSKHDKKDMYDDGEHMALLICIEENDEKIPWCYDKKDKCLCGSINGSYAVYIKVYIRDIGKKMLRKLKIECPYVQKLNKKL